MSLRSDITEGDLTLIENTNKLLSAVGIGSKLIVSVEELRRVAPSMFVAIFEALYQMRIEKVVRQPKFREDYERNAQLVIDHLSDQIGINLTHISGASIVDGDLDALNNLIHIFMRIVSLASEQSISTIESEPSVSTASSQNTIECSSTTSSDNSRILDSAYLKKSLAALDQASKRADKIQSMQKHQSLAEARRKETLQNLRTRVHVRNNTRNARSDFIKHKRFVEDQKSSRRSFEVKALHQEELLLSELYKNIFSEMKNLRIEMQKEKTAATKALIEETQFQVQELEKKYLEKLSVLRKEQTSKEFTDMSSYRETISNIKQMFEKKIMKQIERNDHLREHHLFQRRETILSVFPSDRHKSTTLRCRLKS